MNYELSKEALLDTKFLAFKIIIKLTILYDLFYQLPYSKASFLGRQEMHFSQLLGH